MRWLSRLGIRADEKGIWGWGLNLQVLHAHGIDVPHLIRYPSRPSHAHRPHHTTTYRLAALASTLFAISILLFWLLTHRNPALVTSHDWLPGSLLLAIIAIFFLPLRSYSPAGRARFLDTLRRVSLGGIAEAKDGKFGDILLADVLTSYAKLLGDLYVVLCMFVREGGLNIRPDRDCGGGVVVPVILALPSLIRLRQCVIEYLRVRRAPFREASGWGGQHLANALKYSTAFPVILLSAMQRALPADEPKPTLNRLWLVAVLVNSLYSFYWDVAKDWDLTLLSSERTAPGQHNYGLRRVLYFRPAWVYYAVIAGDLALRCTWAVKLSPRLDRLSSQFEGGIFAIELAEVVRRWVWIFLRVETEWVRSAGVGGMGDVLLGELGDLGGEDSD